MNITELKAELEKDLKIDIENLEIESVNLPGLHGKWLGFAMDQQGLLIGLRGKMKRMDLQKRNYYLGKGSRQEYKDKPFNQTVLKSEVQSFINADPDIRKLQEKIEAKEVLIQYLESAARAVANKQWQIKNAIEFIKFKHGVTG